MEVLGLGVLSQFACVTASATHLFFGTYTLPGCIAKIDASSLEVVDTLILPDVYAVSSAVTDGTFAYFGSDSEPGIVVQIDMTSFSHQRSISLNTSYLRCAITDADRRFGFFATYTLPVIIVRIQLGTLAVAGNFTGEADEGYVISGVCEGAFGYFYLDTGSIVKLELSTMTRAGTLGGLPAFSNFFRGATDGTYTIFGAYDGHLVEIVNANVTNVTAISLAPDELPITAAASDGAYLYLGSGGSSGTGSSKIIVFQTSGNVRVASINVSNAAGFLTAVVHGGNVYFGGTNSLIAVIPLYGTTFAPLGTPSPFSPRSTVSYVALAPLREMIHPPNQTGRQTATITVSLDLSQCCMLAQQFPSDGIKRYFLFDGDSVNCTIDLLGPPVAFDVSIFLIYGGPSVRFSPPNPRIARGSTSVTLTLTAVSPSASTLLFGISSDRSVVLKMEKSMFGVWGKQPVWSVSYSRPYSPPGTFYSTNRSDVTTFINSHSDSFEICSPLDYSGPQHFCVGNATSIGSVVANGPFLLLAASTATVDLPDSAQLLYLCLFSASGKTYHVFSHLSCDALSGMGRVTTVGAIGYAGGTRTSIFGSPMAQCGDFGTTPEGIAVLLDYGSCSRQYETVTDWWFVIDLPNTTKSNCRTFWCKSSLVCLDNASRVCDGVSDCSDGADETSALCSHALSCDSATISFENLCDGIADCWRLAQDESCFDWSLVASDAALPSSNMALSAAFTSVDSGMSTLTCIKLALVFQSNLIGVNFTTGTCIVFRQEDASAMQYSASVVPVKVSGSAGLTFLGNTVSTWVGCFDDVACSGNGRVVDRVTCTCACNAGYYGAGCDSSLDITKWNLMAKLSDDAMKVVSTFFMLLLKQFVKENGASASSLSASNEYYFILSNTTQPLPPIYLMPVLRSPTKTDLSVLYQAIETQYPVFLRTFMMDSAIFANGPLQMMKHASPCDMNSLTGTFSCQLDGSPLVGVTIVTLYVDHALPNMSLDIVTADSAVPHRLTLQRQNAANYPYKLRLNPLSCEQNKHFVDLSEFQSVVAINGSFTSPVQTTGDCAFRWSERPVLFPVIQSPQVVWQNTRVLTSAGNYIPFLASGVVLLVLAAALCVVAVATLYMDLTHFSNAVQTSSIAETQEHAKVDANAAEGLLRLLHQALTTMSFYSSRTPNARIKSISRLSAVCTFNVAVIGIFLVVYYATSDSYSSSHAALIEFFHTSEVDKSFFSPLPLAVAYIDPSDGRACNERATVGTAPLQKLFASAVCDNSPSGGLFVRIRTGTSSTNCNSKAPSILPNEMVLRALDFVERANVGDYVKITCGTVESVKRRYEYFTQAQGKAAGGTSIPQVTQELPSALKQYWTANSNSANTPFQFVRVLYAPEVGFVGAVQTTSSTNPCRLESIARSSSIGPSGMSKLTFPVFQVPSEAFDADPRHLVLTTALEKSFSRNLSDIMAAGWDTPENNFTSLLGPADGDLAVGFRYFLSGTSTTGTPHTKYYGAKDFYTDIGKYFGQGTKETDGMGFTVSFYITATNTSLGFIFAVTDARENLHSGKSPLLEKLMEMLSRGSDASSWSQQGDHVYFGLYLDGPGASLHVVMANSIFDATGRLLPIRSAPSIVDLSWDLAALGLTRLLNGAWHQVAIILRSENAQTKVQLVVDGQTSATKASWNLCSPRKPIAIWDFSKQKVPVNDPTQERALSSGMVLTGYFDGGLSKLQFSPLVDDIFDVWLRATPAIRELNAISSSKYVAVATVLIIIAAIFFCVMLATSGHEVWEERKETLEYNKKVLLDRYGKLWRRCPRDERNVRFRTIPCGAAKHLLGLDDDNALAAFLAELTIIHKMPELELVRLIYIFGEESEDDKNLQAPLPTAEEWETRVVARAKEMAAQFDPDPDEETELSSQQPGGLISERGGGAVVVAGDLYLSGPQQAAPVSSSGATDNSNNHSFSAEAEDTVKQLVLPVLTVLQSVYVWLSTISIPIHYRVNLGSFISVICADFTAAFASIPPIATPLAQLFLGMFFASALYYFLHQDEQAFMTYIGKYVLRRDALSRGEELDAMQGAAAPTSGASCVNVLNIRDAQQVDHVLGRNGEDTETENKRVVVHTTITGSEDSTAFVVEKTEKLDGTMGAIILATKSAQESSSFRFVLEDVGCYCATHRDRFLGTQIQTDIWPFENPQRCCLSIEGVPCGTSTGKMYVCGQIDVDGNGESSPCGYALCEKHMRADGVGLLRADFLSFRRTVLADGSMLFLVASLFLCNTLYTPFLKTALMILGCHPYFQCLFPTCWSPVDRNYALAVFLSLVIVVFLGLGFPLILTLLLFRRTASIREIFFAPCYEGKYGSSPRTVDLGEWLHFVTTDPTAMSSLYKSFELEWIYVSSVLIAWKVVLLIPPVFAESGSFEQSVGIAVVEFSYGLFIFATQPSIAPMTDLMFKLGAVHQMLFLGLQNLDTYFRYHKGSGGSISTAMVGTTVGYLLLCLLCIVWTKIAPIVLSIRERKKIGRLLNELGMHYSSSTSLFCVVNEKNFTAVEVFPEEGK